MCGNEWFSYLSFSNTHSCSFWNGSVWLELAESAAGRGVLLQLLSTRWSSRRYELGCHAPVHVILKICKHIFQHYCNWNIVCIAVAIGCQGIHLKMQSIYTIFYKYNLPFNVEHHALLSIIGLFQIFQMIPVLSAIRAVCFRQCHIVVTAQQKVTSPPSWLPCQNALQNGCLHDVRDASLACESSQFLVSVCMAYDFNSIIL